MSESTKSAPLGDAATGPIGPEAPSTPSVRELLAELARLEDATRETGGARRPTWTARTADLAADLAREREIIEEWQPSVPGRRRTTGRPGRQLGQGHGLTRLTRCPVVDPAPRQAVRARAGPMQAGRRASHRSGPVASCSSWSSRSVRSTRGTATNRWLSPS